MPPSRRPPLAAAAREALDLGRWQPWLDTTGHSDTPPEMLATLGVAVAVVGACLLLGRHLRRLVWPGSALGRFALTVYVGHIVAYGLFRPAFYNETVAGGTEATLWISGVGAVVAMVWLAFLQRGPLEALDRGAVRSHWSVSCVANAPRLIPDVGGAPWHVSSSIPTTSTRASTSR